MELTDCGVKDIADMIHRFIMCGNYTHVLSYPVLRSCNLDAAS